MVELEVAKKLQKIQGTSGSTHPLLVHMRLPPDTRPDPGGRRPRPGPKALQQAIGQLKSEHEAVKKLLDLIRKRQGLVNTSLTGEQARPNSGA